MKPRFAQVVSLFLLGSQILVSGKLTPEQAQQLPAPSNHQVDFSKEIKPIFESSCIKCHGRGRDKGDLRIDTRETLLKGGESGPAVIVGKSAESYLIELVMGFDPDNTMPKKGSRLTPNQIGLLRAWIDQGLKWDAGASFGRLEPINLKPRRPELPASRTRKVNPIDLLLQPYFDSHQIKPPKPIEDAAFARRAYLDVIGLLPSPEELKRFEADRRSNKGEMLVRRLLADNQHYAVHWLTIWNDALRNDYRGTGYIDGGRTQITQWLYSALETNLPYDRFVAQLIDPTPPSEGFVKGIVWRGVVNASQTPQMQAAQNISQVFMGVNLKCASCHDSFINDWTLADAYGLAGIYADGPLEMVHCDKPTGKHAPLRFIYSQLGDIDPAAEKSARLKQLAALICQRQDGRLTRTVVNRLWQRFLGRGLVEPADDMEKAAWNQDLLDWLAEDFADHGYDLKHAIEQILTSRAYQYPAVIADEQNQTDFVFRGPLVRRMTAEQFRDALTALTGIGYSVPAADINFASGKSAAELANVAPVPAKWIWSHPDAAQKAKTGPIFLRKSFFLPAVPAEAAVMVLCDNSFILYLNAKKVGDGHDLSKPYFFDIRSRLRKGENFFSVKAVNNSRNNTAPKNDEAEAGQENPAGFLLYARLRDKGKIMDFASDGSWIWCPQINEWIERKITPSKWKPVSELGGISIPPWKLGTNYVQKMFSGVQLGKVRAAFVNADTLQIALGRPNREQVVTARSSAATTLQALELTNGSELANLLGRSAERILDEQPHASARDLIQQLYLKALGRKPTSNEMHLAREIVGERPQKAGLEDLMWSLAMLPEFQLIY